MMNYLFTSFVICFKIQISKRIAVLYKKYNFNISLLGVNGLPSERLSITFRKLHNERTYVKNVPFKNSHFLTGTFFLLSL